MNINLSFAKERADLPIGTIIQQGERFVRLFEYRTTDAEAYIRCTHCHLLDGQCNNIACGRFDRRDNKYVIGIYVTEEGGAK